MQSIFFLTQFKIYEFQKVLRVFIEFLKKLAVMTHAILNLSKGVFIRHTLYVHVYTHSDYKRCENFYSTDKRCSSKCKRLFFYKTQLISCSLKRSLFMQLGVTLPCSFKKTCVSKTLKN